MWENIEGVKGVGVLSCLWERPNRDAARKKIVDHIVCANIVAWNFAIRAPLHTILSFKCLNAERKSYLRWGYCLHSPASGGTLIGELHGRILKTML